MNGFFNQEALEALQQAYEMQLTPDEMDIDQVTGLPTNQVSNTSPWHGTVDLWRYPDGKNKLETSPIMYRAGEGGADLDDEDEYDDGIVDETDSSSDEDEDDTLTDEEIDTLIEELLDSDEDED
jgi:hypothetical protein